MKKSSIILVLLPIFLFSLGTTVSAKDTNDTLSKSVLKLKTYTRDVVSGNYTFSHYGSAVFIGKNRILTNAHVILDADGIAPTGYYEACQSENTQKPPVCFTTAKLISYDSNADLALLELAAPTSVAKTIEFSSKNDISMWASIIVYGYPQIGGFSITRTEGKIGGNDDTKYKFDGTIDHGNSWGGAFDIDGKLIGIPYAVKSDNGMIGYIIPISQVQDFLAGRSDNPESFRGKVEADFSKYITQNQALYKNSSLLKNKYVEVKNAEKNGFTLVNTISSINGTNFLYQFLDKNNRVVINIWCTNDASKTWTSPIDFAIVSSALPDETGKTKTTTGYLDTAKSIFMREITSIKETKGERAAIASILYQGAPRCGTVILAQDVKNKDKATYQKGIAFLKTIKFLDKTPISTSFSSSFLSLKNIPKNVVLSEGASMIYGGNIRPSIHALFPNQYITSSDFELLEFEDLDGYMNYEYSETNQYTGKDYSYDSFFQRYKTTGYRNVTDMDITTKEGKKMIMTIKNYNDRTSTPEKYEQEVVFFYPFMTKEGKYRAYKFSFTLHSKDGMDEYTMRDIMMELELPGTSPFKK